MYLFTKLIAFESLISQNYTNFILTVECIGVAIYIMVIWNLKYLILVQVIYTVEAILKVHVCFLSVVS